MAILETRTYEDAASSTTPPTVHTRLVRPAVVFYLLSEFTKAGKALDLYVKKPFVYGEDRVQLETDKMADLVDIDCPRDLDEREAAFAHGVVGLATESAEAVELLMKMWFFNEHVEAAAVIDEAGDNLWYIVRMLRALGSDLPSAMRANVAKLQARHHRDGKTFNPNADRDRDREAESRAQEALERADTSKAATVFYSTRGTPLAVNALGGPMRDATEDEMRTLPPDPASFVTGKLAPVIASEPYLGLATNRELEAEIEARKSMGHTDPEYRTASGTPASEQRGIACLSAFDDGSEIWLDSYSGGASSAGLFGAVTLRTYATSDDSEGVSRSYIANDLIGNSGAQQRHAPLHGTD